MAHVLIDGDSKQLPEVHSFLRSWGWTIGRMPADATARGQASRSECDLVIFLCDDCRGGSRVEAGYLKRVPPIGDRDGVVPESAAPLLVIGRGPLAEIMGRQARHSIEETGSDGSLLREALGVCLAGRGPIDSPSQPAGSRDQQLHFLGHELRSPLTAIKTALEVMQGDLWLENGGPDSDDARSDDSQLRMLEIALRNVRRMHSAVEWSQDLLKFEDSRQEAETRPIYLAGLCEGLSQLSGSNVQLVGNDQLIECDADLLLHLAGQAIQAMRLGCPELPLRLIVEAAEPGAERLTLRVQRDESGSADDSNAASGPNPDELRLHLQRFADYLNPSGALVDSGSEVQVRTESADHLGLSLTFEIRPAAVSTSSLVG